MVHQSTIPLTRALDRGSTFVVASPLGLSESSPRESAAMKAARPIEVLLVEDDEDLRDAMTDTLSDAGYTCVSAGNGLEALEWLSEAPEPPRLILLDLMMPVMDGWQFRKERQKSPELLAIPLVVLCASVNFAGEKDVECLQKPPQLPVLLALLERYCGPRPKRA